MIGMISMLSSEPRRIAAFWSGLIGLPIADDASEYVVMLALDHEIGCISWILQRSLDLRIGLPATAVFRDTGGEAVLPSFAPSCCGS